MSDRATGDRPIVFLTHTGVPGGAELSLATYLEQSQLPRPVLMSLQPSTIWERLRPKVELVICPQQLPAAARPTWLRRQITTRAPALVVANTMRIAFIASMILPPQIPMAYWVRDGLGSDSAMSTASRMLTRFVTIPRTRLFITNSPWTEASLRRIRPTATSLVVPSPTGLHQHELLASKPRRNPDSPIRLLYLGRLSEWKAPHVAIKALEELEYCTPNAYRLSIAGDAQFASDEAYRAYLRGLVATSTAASRIDLLGHVLNTRALLMRSDLLVHCSTKPEPFGRVLIEAMGRGVPVVATYGGGPSTIVVPNINGELYSPGESTALVRAVQRVTERYSEYSEGALATADDYTDEKIVERLDAWLQKTS